MINKLFTANADTLNSSVLTASPHHFWIIKPLGLSLLLSFTLSNGYAAQSSSNPITTQQVSIQSEELQMWITIGERRFSVTLANTDAAREFAAILPLTLNMDDLHSNEKHAELPKAIPTETYLPRNIRNGDLMLWGSRTMVVFYKDFDTTYPYTRIRHIEDSADLPKILGRGSIQITFSHN
jgi:hypothetical protein